MFYLISTQILNDNTKAQQINAYESKAEAESNFHSTNGANYISETLKTWSCQVVDDLGNSLMKKFAGEQASNDAYYVISLQDTGEANPCSITAKDDKNDALSTMEMTASSNCVSEVLKSWASFVINKIGGRVDGYSYQEPEPEPEPNAE